MFNSEIRSPEQNKNEQIALKMQTVLDKVKQPQNYKALSEAGYEFASERYDSGQTILEKNGFWHDAVREVAVDANQAERNKNNNSPLSFTEAKGAIGGYAKALAELGTREDIKSAMEIESIISGSDRPGVEGVDEALKYIEGVLQTKAGLKRMTPDIKAQWDEQRAVRDALFLEKQKRIERSKQVQQSNAIPHSHFKEAVKDSQEQDEKELADLRESLGLNEKELPDDRRGLFRYFKDNFGKIEDVSLDEFKKDFTPEIEDDFRKWIEQYLKTIIRDKPANARYPDNLASVFGNNAPFIQRVIALKSGRVVNMEKLLTMPFSQAAKEYLGMDLPEDYFNNFSPRPPLKM